MVAKNRELNGSLTTRSKTQPLEKSACVICQTPGGKLHEVMFDSTGKDMLSVSKNVEDKPFFRRLNSISHAEDAVATMYCITIFVGILLNVRLNQNRIP